MATDHTHARAVRRSIQGGYKAVEAMLDLQELLMRHHYEGIADELDVLRTKLRRIVVARATIAKDE